MPSVYEIAEAVKDYLNAQVAAEAYPQAFAAVRRYAPLETYDDLKDLDVAVAAANRQKSWSAPFATRAQPGKATQVGIFIVKRLAQATDPSLATGNTEIDALVALCEAIDDSFLPGPLTGLSGVRVAPEESNIEVDADALNQKLFNARILIPFIYAS
jgi:hypothetical protein